MSSKHPNIKEVNQANFQTEVIQRSQQTPVVVDFWAPWCGPCRMLGPILERLAAEPGSKFVLAKVNADHNPQLSMQYGVRGIPAVKAFWNGRVIDEFVGAQPEPMVRQFIRRLPDGRTAPKAGPSARPQPSAQVSSDPAQRLRQARQLLRQSKGCQALTHLRNFPAGAQANSARKLLPLAQFLCDAQRSGIGGSSDLDILYSQAADALRRREYSGALYNLLALLHQDKNYRGGQARQVMEGVFELLGENDSLTRAYRQQMGSIFV